MDSDWVKLAPMKWQGIDCRLSIVKKNLKIPKGVIRIRISKKNRQHNGQKKKYKRTNNDLQNIHIKTKDRITRTPLKTGGELRCSGRVGSSCSTSGTHRVNLVTNQVINREWGKDRELFTTNRRYPCLFVTKIFHNGQRNHGGDRKYHYIIFC